MNMQSSSVLCLDDDEVLLGLLQTVLERNGYIVLPARNGHQALRLAAERQFDAVILDYSLPDLTGGQVASQIRELKPNIPILIFSGACDIPPGETAQADAVLSKGGGLHVLLALLGRLISQAAWPPLVRRLPRYSVQLPFALLAERSGAWQMLRGVATSIGEGGIGGTVDGRLLPGETVQISLSDSQAGMRLEPRAQVRYGSRDRYGFAFLEVTVPEQDDLRRYCRRLANAQA
jgi:CheY-like chemotaxis protein